MPLLWWFVEALKCVDGIEDGGGFEGTRGFVDDSVELLASATKLGHIKQMDEGQQQKPQSVWQICDDKVRHGRRKMSFKRNLFWFSSRLVFFDASPIFLSNGNFLANQ